MIELNWGESIETAYQQYLNFGHTKDWTAWQLYPTMYYKQMVQDGFISPDAWRLQMPETRKYILEDLQRQVAALRTSREWNEATNVHQIKVTNKEHEIVQYRNGAMDDKLELMSKQWLVLQVFKEAKKRKMEHIYQPENKV